MTLSRDHSFLFFAGPLAAAMSMGACTTILGGIDSTGSTSSGSGGSGGSSTTASSSTGAGNHGGSGGASGCKTGEKMCDGKCAPADTAHGCDADSCDACPHAHGDVHCVAGACEAYQCDTGFKDCDGKAENGCEVNVATDPDNCGDCAHGCPQGMQFCGGGQCSAIMCTAPKADCDGLAANQCEVDTSNDVGNCGACKHVCGAAEGTPSCSSGGCQFACNPGYAHCSPAPADDVNGCDVHTDGDIGNCGACGHSCATAGGTGSASCESGACQFSCTAPWVDCGSGHDQNGCNVDTANDPSNCGGCGVSCNGANTTGACVRGACVCKSGYFDYDADASNGCEAGIPTAVAEAASLVLWLEGDVAWDGYTWGDQSGNIRNANHYMNVALPKTSTLNGKPVLSFLQGEQLTVNEGFPAWGGLTIFGVTNTHVSDLMFAMGVSYNPGCSTTPPAGAPGCVPYDMLSADVGLQMCDPSYGACYQATGVPTMPLDTWVRYSARVDPNAAAGFSSYLNGVQTTATSGRVPAPWYTHAGVNATRIDTLIAYRNFRGMIAEYIIFNVPVSDASRTAIDNYLAHKWGL